MEGDEEPEQEPGIVDDSAESLKDKKQKKKKKDGVVKKKKRNSEEGAHNRDADFSDGCEGVVEETANRAEANHVNGVFPDNDNAAHSVQTDASLESQDHDQTGPISAHSEPHISTPTPMSREPTGPNVSQSESMPSMDSSASKKRAHIPLIGPLTDLVGGAGEAALKPIRFAAVKVKDDVTLLVRDPKQFAKQKKCEVRALPPSRHSAIPPRHSAAHRRTDTRGVRNRWRGTHRPPSPRAAAPSPRTALPKRRRHS